MFGAKQRLQGYLEVIRPWAEGRDHRGWRREDFETPVSTGPGDEGYPEWTPIPEVAEYRLDPSHVIFPLVPYDLTIDRLFLPVPVVVQVMAWNQKIAAFNAALERLNAATERDVKWALIVLLHAGTIGQLGGAGLYQGFRMVEASLNVRR